jgi:hypothetical protein
MTKTAPIGVSFHDLEEYLAELRIDKDRIDRGILRVTARRRYGNPFVTTAVVATAVVEGVLVKLEHRVGDAFAGDETAAGLDEKTRTALGKLSDAGNSLGLDVRAGVFE